MWIYPKFYSFDTKLCLKQFNLVNDIYMNSKSTYNKSHRNLSYDSVFKLLIYELSLKKNNVCLCGNLYSLYD